MLDSTNDSCSLYYIPTLNQLWLLLRIHKQLQSNFCLRLFWREKKNKTSEFLLNFLQGQKFLQSAPTTLTQKCVSTTASIFCVSWKVTEAYSNVYLPAEAPRLKYDLQTYKGTVGRLAPGAHKITINEAVQSDVG